MQGTRDDLKRKARQRNNAYLQIYGHLIHEWVNPVNAKHPNIQIN